MYLKKQTHFFNLSYHKRKMSTRLRSSSELREEAEEYIDGLIDTIVNNLRLYWTPQGEEALRRAQKAMQTLVESTLTPPSSPPSTVALTPIALDAPFSRTSSYEQLCKLCEQEDTHEITNLHIN